MATRSNSSRKEIGAFCRELRQLRIEPEQIVLFGSHALKRAHHGSDVDLIVISRDFHRKSLRRRLELLGMAAARALVPVQALGYTPEEVGSRDPGDFLDDILTGTVVRVAVS